MYKYKTLKVKATDEFGILEVQNEDLLMVATSSTPHLFNKDVTLEDIKKYYNNYLVEFGTFRALIPFDYDKEIGDKWELIDCEVKLNK